MSFCSPAAGLLECLCVPHSGVLSSLLACANGVTSAVLVLAVLGLSLQRLRLWLAPLPGTVSDSTPATAASPAPHRGCCLLIPWKTREKDSWFPLSSCSPSPSVLSLWTKSKRWGKSDSLSFLVRIIHSCIHSTNIYWVLNMSQAHYRHRTYSNQPDRQKFLPSKSLHSSDRDNDKHE